MPEQKGGRVVNKKEAGRLKASFQEEKMDDREEYLT
jgi:hypothetical protein